MSYDVFTIPLPKLHAAALGTGWELPAPGMSMISTALSLEESLGEIYVKRTLW